MVSSGGAYATRPDSQRFAIQSFDLFARPGGRPLFRFPVGRFCLFSGRAVSGWTLTTGNYVRRRVTSALSITVPSGQAIGAPSGQGFAFYLEAIDNGGTVELAVFNPVIGGAAATSIICPQESNGDRIRAQRRCPLLPLRPRGCRLSDDDAP